MLFQIGDFVRTARDTEHNLGLFSLVEKYGESDEDRKELLQYKPYVVRMNAIARAMISLHKEMKSAAEDILTSAISAIEGMREIDTPAFQFERVRSLNYLKATLKQIHDKKDSPLEALKSELPPPSTRRTTRRPPRSGTASARPRGKRPLSGQGSAEYPPRSALPPYLAGSRTSCYPPSRE